jgi:hypothetical protein
MGDDDRSEKCKSRLTLNTNVFKLLYAGHTEEMNWPIAKGSESPGHTVYRLRDMAFVRNSMADRATGESINLGSLVSLCPWCLHSIVSVAAIKCSRFTLRCP